MLSHLFAAACAALPAAEAWQAPVQQALAAPVEVAIQITPTALHIRSLAPDARALIFRADRARVVRALPAFGELTFRFPSHLLEGVELEVASFGGGRWSTSGSFALDALAASGADALWIQSGPVLRGWLQVGEALWPETSNSSSLPGWLPMNHGGGDDYIDAPLHVPVIPPAERKRGDVPPRLEDKPLPPV